MIAYMARRLVYMVFTFWILSVVVFMVIRLPRGDFVTSRIALLRQQGTAVDQAEAEALRLYYGLDRSPIEQYLMWFGRLVRGDMGQSFEWERPVASLLKERLPGTAMLSIFALVFTYLVAVPVGIYSAIHPYTVRDYVFSVVGLAGVAIPNFMLALILMFLFYRYFGLSLGGLFSREHGLAPWSLAKAWDLFQHLWVPIIVIGTSGTAGLIRVIRATLLDELGKQYVVTARAKGVPERRLLLKYPVRVAINPIVSTIGWSLPGIVSGETITAIVLGLPTTGPLLYGALRTQDMYMAGSIVMALAVLTLIGTLLSDILLVIVDPRIRFERKD